MDIFGKQDDSLVINLESITKTSLSEFADKIISNVIDGNADPIREYIKAKGLAELATQISDGLKDEAIREAEKYNGQETIYGCKIQIKSTPTSYDFSHDEEWKMINDQIEKLKATQKAREKKMIDAMGYAELVDESGEVIPPAQVKKAGGQTIAITIPV